MKKIKIIFATAATLTLILVSGFILSPQANAATSSDGGGASPSSNAITDPCHPENNDPPGQPLSADQLASCQNCKKVKNNDQTTLQKCLKNNPIVKDLNDIITFLSALVGVVIVGALIYGGIRYSMAGDNPQQTAAAKEQITNALIGLVAFISIFSILQWLIPGGLFS